MEAPDFGDYVALAAFALSVLATGLTVWFHLRQQSLNDTQEKLNKFLLERGESETAAEKKADLGAELYNIGNNNYRVKIWNKGKGTARNVRVVPEHYDLLIERDVSGKFPLESLEMYQSVELIARVHMQSASKHKLKLLWADNFKDENEKEVYLTL